MKTILSFLLILLVASSAIAWGPKAHTEIGTMALEDSQQEIKGNPESYLLGNILPDMALALKNYRGSEGEVWYERHRLFHSDDFINALTELSNTAGERAFVAGWQAHLISDKVEKAYSQRKIKEGAPASADYPVDILISITQKVSISISIRDLIQEALGSRWNISSTDWLYIENAYNAYFFTPAVQELMEERYGAIANKWYGDYEEELIKSVRAIIGDKDILAYYRALAGDPNAVELSDVVQAANDYLGSVIPPGFTAPITLSQIVELAGIYFG